jgi:hypothetical protein
MKQDHIFRIKIRDKKKNEEDFIIMGDSYKSFNQHFLDVIGMFTENWVYNDTPPEKKGPCLGRVLSVEFIEIQTAKERFVSFGGPKMVYEQNYDKLVEEHNKNVVGEACKYLKDVTFVPMDVEILHQLLKDCRVKVSEYKCCNNCKLVSLVANRMFCGNRESSNFSKTINDWHKRVCKQWVDPMEGV